MNNGVLGGPPGNFLSGSDDSVGIPMYVREIRSSQTWIAPGNGYADILVIGAGGSGGVGLGLSNSTQRVLGGNAGGTAYKRVRVIRGQRVVFTMGAGGAGRVIGSTSNVNGLAGGTTTVVSTGVYIIVPGGAGGTSAVTTSAANPTAATLPSGGDINLAGGLGGAISADATTSHGATGGGAPNLFGVACNGGAISSVGGNAASGGGGVLASGDIATGGPSGGGSSVNSLGILTLFNYMQLTGASSAGATNTNSANVSGFGGGSGGVVTNALSQTGIAPFGGTGGITGSGFGVGSGNVTWGGGSGGASGNTANVFSGNGGNAFALVVYYPGA